MVATILARRICSSLTTARCARPEACRGDPDAAGTASRAVCRAAAPPASVAAMTDLALARRLAKLQSILDVAKAMTAERQLDRLLALVVDAAAKVAEPERCAILL